MALSPVNQRRWNQFKSNKRGYYALWLFIIVSFLSFAAPFIANEKPIVVCYKGEYYFPIFKNYAETTFGGTFETTANFREQFIQDSIKKDGWILSPIVPFGPSSINYDLPTPAPSPPTKENILGTDDQGRDVFARLIYGLRVSIFFGVVLTIFSTFIGISLGAIQGYFGGKIDLYGQRIIEVWAGLPVLYLLIILSSMIQPNIFWLMGIMLLFSWIPLVGVLRAEFFRTRSLDYVRAAEALGVPTMRIIYRHMLPNAMVAALTYIPFMLNTSIIMLTSLDFLGFGLPPGSPSLGELITQSKNNVQAPWLGISAFLAISCILSLLIFIGEAVRDGFDSKKIMT
jgi:microcin C transport system permease protein